ncbi:MAG TPA: YlxR family protein [Candidatus Dormibacteraeota bacterium]
MGPVRKRPGRTEPKAGPRPAPRRSCVACRQVKAKRDLVRLVAVDGRILRDDTGRAPGRGAYLCRDAACWTSGERRRALDRALHLHLAAEDWTRLREGILS